MATHTDVTVFEVGPRDGLQNESKILSVEDKLWFISGLIQAGIRDLEFGAFVRPDRVPQMADTDLLYPELEKKRQALVENSVRTWSLVPNEKGLERALKVGVKHIALFTAATDTFARKNIGMSIDESLAVFKKMRVTAKAYSLQVRGYVSTAFGCPFEGKVSAQKALEVVEKLAELEVDQISIGDTIGVATPKQVEELMKPALKLLGPKKVAGHFHDTRGTALANSLRALDLGVRILDSSAGGLGGCPFAPSATGNLPTEDLVYMLNGMGLRTGIDLDQLCQVSLELARRMQRPLSSRCVQTYAAQCASQGLKKL